MKKIIISFLVVFTFGLFWNCSTIPSEKNHNLQRKWMLVSFSNFTKEQLIKSKAAISLTAEKESGKIPGSAFMGCNRMFFTSDFKDNGKVKISGLGGTMMACSNMELENSFAQSFENMTHYLIRGHELILSDEKGNEMKFIAADWD
ncbi:META domain-containing protein [Chryseobacterium sp.]|uniref:META domain-containing protein n=1 Tax=Chryseobacterium sp. TaxID=1871047 RepID=UPI0025BEA2A7|nr:META domain-containing protein [Chryseobacterium sp.]